MAAFVDISKENSLDRQGYPLLSSSTSILYRK